MKDDGFQPYNNLVRELQEIYQVPKTVQAFPEGTQVLREHLSKGR
ncbi:MAG: hypothetical protein ABS939_05480 [Psychrobacillus sp.]